MTKPKVVILCGGQGTRMREETEFKPKPMVTIGEKPILWHIMKIYSHFGFNDFVLCLGYKGHMIKEFFINYLNRTSDYELNIKSGKIKYFDEVKEDWNIIFAETGTNTSTGARIKKIEKYIEGEDFFLTYGDGVANIDIRALFEYHKANNALGTVTAVRPLTRFGLLEIKDKTVTDFKKRNLVHEGRIDGGFFVFNRKFFSYLSDNEDCALEGEPLQKLAKDKKFVAFSHDGYWQCMDTVRQAEYLNECWASGNAPWKLW